MPPAATRREDLARQAELEAAIVASPDDPGARMIYGDWLQSRGDPRGEWAAMMAAIEATPEATRLRSAAVEFLSANRVALFGKGAPALVRSYLGWRGGFLDELRIQPTPSANAGTVKALLSHPSSRFVRHIALGDLGTHRAAAFHAVVTSHLPLLDELVAMDAIWRDAWEPVAGLGKLAALRRLTLSGVVPAEPLPQLRALTTVAATQAHPMLEWIANRGCPALEELTLIGPPDLRAIVDLPRLRDALPSLRSLSLVNFFGADELVDSIEVPRLELAHSPISEATRAALANRLELVETAPGTSLYSIANLTDPNWFLDRARTHGRAGVRHVPGLGGLLWAATMGSLGDGQRVDVAAIPFLDLSATLPAAQYVPYQLANAAIAHERAGHLDEAELRGREALLTSPREPNFHAIVVDALRRTNRLADAERALPAAIRAIANPARDSQPTAAAACLLDCMLVLAQVGKHGDAIALAARFADKVDERHHALLAMSELARGNQDQAKRWFRKAQKADLPIVDHARAVMSVAYGNLVEARAALARAQATNYSEPQWLAVDPLLAAIGEKPSGRPGLPARNRGARKPR